MDASSEKNSSPQDSELEVTSKSPCAAQVAPNPFAASTADAPEWRKAVDAQRRVVARVVADAFSREGLALDSWLSPPPALDVASGGLVAGDALALSFAAPRARPGRVRHHSRQSAFERSRTSQDAQCFAGRVRDLEERRAPDVRPVRARERPPPYLRTAPQTLRASRRQRRRERPPLAVTLALCLGRSPRESALSPRARGRRVRRLRLAERGWPRHPGRRQRPGPRGRPPRPRRPHGPPRDRRRRAARASRASRDAPRRRGGLVFGLGRPRRGRAPRLGAHGLLRGRRRRRQEAARGRSSVRRPLARRRVGKG